MESKCDVSDDDWDDSGSRRYNKYRDKAGHPEPDRASDGEGRPSKSYSDDYDNESERSLSPYVRDQALSPVPLARNNCISTSSPYNTASGTEKRARARPPRSLRSRAARSHSKESLPPKELDPLTRQMLSGRLLKINELRNVHGELQLRIAELQKENRILKQLQTRQEKALQNYTDAESKISQMLSCHANETHVLRERLRRARERERATERRLKEKEEQLLRSHATVGRMKKLVEQRELGAREELSCKLEQERARAREADLKIKELERNMELCNGSHQRQLAAERKKTLSAQEEIRSLHKELEQLAKQLREKERELEIRNIYAHRVTKASPRKAGDDEARYKGETRPGRRLSFDKVRPGSTASPFPTVTSRWHSKAVQTQERGDGGSPDFPSPPPAPLVDCGDPAPDGYLSLKQADGVDSGPEAKLELELELELEQQQSKQDLREHTRDRWQHGSLQAKAAIFSHDWAKEKEEEEPGSFLSSAPERVQVQDEAERRRKPQHAADAGEARRRKDQLLAKMREIDLHNQAARNPVFADSPESDGETSPGRRRSLRSLKSDDEPVFGSCAPLPGNRARDDGEHALEAIGVFSLKGGGAQEKSKKSALMQQLFGSLASPPGDARAAAELLDEVTGGPRGGSRAAGRSLSARHVVDSRPAVRVIPSFDDDIEELTL